jgi:hypothetical protein
MLPTDDDGHQVMVTAYRPGEPKKKKKKERKSYKQKGLDFVYQEVYVCQT